MIRQIVKLIRVRQWYKNLLVFLPLLFVGLLFDMGQLFNTFLAFLALCAISSINYIINDLIDVKKDRAHPEKRDRPLASGAISPTMAVVLVGILLLVSLTIAMQFAPLFLVMIGLLFSLTFMYSLFLKHEPFVDILMISINFVIRAVSGTFVINVAISPWLILCPFFLALFLAAGKRKSDLMFLKEGALKHKPVLQYYSQEISSALLIITATATILCYALYAFLNNKGKLIFTMPFAVYVILRYMYHIFSGTEISRHPEKAYKDWRLAAGALAWTLTTVFIMYLF